MRDYLSDLIARRDGGSPFQRVKKPRGGLFNRSFLIGGGGGKMGKGSQYPLITDPNEILMNDDDSQKFEFKDSDSNQSTSRKFYQMSHRSQLEINKRR